MQVGTLRVAGPSGFADQLAGTHPVAFAHTDFRQVAVNRAHIVAVLQKDDETVAAHFAGKRDIAFLHGGNGRAHRDGDIHAVMEIRTEAQKAQPPR